MHIQQKTKRSSELQASSLLFFNGKTSNPPVIANRWNLSIFVQRLYWGWNVTQRMCTTFLWWSHHYSVFLQWWWLGWRDKHQKTAACHTVPETMDMLKNNFDIIWYLEMTRCCCPTKSCNLTFRDYFLWGHTESRAT